MAEIMEKTLAGAWRQAIAAAVESDGSEVIPLTVTISLGQPDSERDQDFEARLDSMLLRERKQEVETVARTIFPMGLWNPAQPRQQLFERYQRILPKLHKYHQNRRGLYFERLISIPNHNGARPFNQLEHVISAYLAGVHRRTTLQATPFVPQRDLNRAPRSGFPCLQQVSFLPNSKEGSLTILGFYPVHHLFERAYGNYLGLIWLGRFMAHEMGLRLSRMTCVAGVGKLEVQHAIVQGLMR